MGRINARWLIAWTGIIAALGLSNAPQAMPSSQRDALIKEEYGTAGALRIRDRVSQHPFLRPLQGNVWASRNQSYIAVVDSGRKITQIIVTGKGMFTQRLVKIHFSTVRDAVSAYGSPSSTNVAGSFLLFDYGAFSFVAHKPQRRSDVMASKIVAVVLKPRGSRAHLPHPVLSLLR